MARRKLRREDLEYPEDEESAGPLQEFQRHVKEAKECAVGYSEEQMKGVNRFLAWLKNNHVETYLVLEGSKKMNYYQASERKKDKKFDFTHTHDKITRATGYCAAFRPFTDDEIKEWSIPAAEVTRHNSHKDKHHDTGHATKDEACDCYRQYLLDNRAKYHDDQADAATLHKCKVCGEFTSGCVEVDHGESLPLCKQHRNRETLEKIYPKIGYITSSW